MENEIWKDIFYVDVRNNNIIDYRGLYQVSNKGNVKSLNYNHTGKEKLLKLKTDKDGYRECLLVKNKENKYFRVHRLVAEMFIDNPEKKHFIDHIIPVNDGGTDCAENLRWSTTKENNNNKITIEKHKKIKGKKHPRSMPIVAVNKNNKYDIIFFESFGIAEESIYKFSHKEMKKVIDGIHKQHKGFLFYLLEDYVNYIMIDIKGE